jgi:hypothetical protein
MSISSDLARMMLQMILGTAATTAATLLVAGATMTMAPRAAVATPAFAQQTGKPCGFCHSKTPELNDEGKKFKANGNKL